MDDFEKYLNESMEGMNLDLKPGAKVSGTIVAIDAKSVFVDLRATGEGYINREELTDRDGELTVGIGDRIEAIFVDEGDDGIQLSVKMTGHLSDQHLEDAYRGRIPVEGKVVAERKGGYTVKVGGSEAFCPYSQMGNRGADSAACIGQTLLFMIQEMSRGNLLVSRRPVLEKEREIRLKTLRDELKIGDVVDGTVTNVRDFGAFVDLGGAEGLIPAGEIAWGGRANPAERFKAGDSVRVIVSGIDWDRNRITLSFRSANRPWDEIADDYPNGTRCGAKITRLESFGAFAELEPGLEGLIHISRLGAGRRVGHPREVVREGDEVEVEVLGVDLERHRIALSIERKAEENEKEPASEPVNEDGSDGDVQEALEEDRTADAKPNVPTPDQGSKERTRPESFGNVADVFGTIRFPDS